MQQKEVELVEEVTSLTNFRPTDQTKRKKVICLITGTAGAGKSLAGLNIATERMRYLENEHAVFLSGNGPLVEVLREALVQDQMAENGSLPKDEKVKRNTHIYHGIKLY